MLLLTQVLASQPAWCVASWTAPIEGCALDGRMRTSAAGPSADEAAEAARKRLARVVDLAAGDLIAAKEVGHAQVASCADAAKAHADVACSAVQSPKDGNYCFVTFEDAECWDDTVITIPRGGWRAVVSGRAQMCEAVDERLEQKRYVNLEEIRDKCRARCATGVVVSCPPER